MQEMAGGLGTRLAISLLAGLMLPFSGAPNAVYGLPDMYRLLLSVCSREGGESSAEAQYHRRRALKSVKRLPSRRRMLDIIKEVRRDHMLSRCSRMVTRSMLQARRHGMQRRPIDVTIDEHDIPSYARVMDMAYAVFSRYKKGTKKFHRLATLHCVVGGHRPTLDVEVVRRGDDTAETVQRLLWRARRRGIHMSSITIDRGFHSVDVIETIKAAGMPLVMPAVKLDPVKDILKKYEAGEREVVSAHTMTNSAGRSTTYTLVILERVVLKKEYAGMTPEHGRLADLHDDDARVRQYYVFATTMGEGWIGGDPHRVAEFYRRRWGIENSYKSYEATRPRTTSTDYSVRILLRFIPFILYNVWILARFTAARGGGHHPGARPPVTLGLSVSALLDAANMQPAGNPGGHPPDFKPVFQTPDTRHPAPKDHAKAAGRCATRPACGSRPAPLPFLCHPVVAAFRAVISIVAGPRSHSSGLGLRENQERKYAPPLSEISKRHGCGQPFLRRSDPGSHVACFPTGATSRRFTSCPDLSFKSQCADPAAMMDGLKTVGSMAVRPNATFAIIRDNAHHYRWWAAGIFGLVSVLSATVSWTNPVLFRDGAVPEIAWNLASVILGGLASVFVIWAVGKSNGGNPDRDKVITVIFYTHIPTIIGYSLTALVMPVLDSGTLANFMLSQTVNTVTGVGGPPGLGLPMAEIVAYVTAAAILLGTGAWAIILLVKAIRVVHGCHIIQAIGIGLAGTVSAVAVHILVGWFLIPSIRWSMTL